MFEGKSSHHGYEGGESGKSSAGGSLREVAWGELISRLAAARDLRCELGASTATGEASFDPESARRIAAARGDDKPEINPDALGDGKDAGTKETNRLKDLNTGDRGQE
jgi:hypothetical protein